MNKEVLDNLCKQLDNLDHDLKHELLSFFDLMLALAIRIRTHTKLKTMGVTYNGHD